jgi:O-antigen/teichoic acid export membrane protein
MTTRPSASNTQTIARNSFWYGLEALFGIGAAFVTSIIVARTIGPVRLGPFQSVMFLASITGAVGGAGLAITTRKYMAEYLNRGETGTALAIYRHALGLQAWVSVALTVAGVAAAFLFTKPELHLVSAVLALSIAPRMIGFIPSNANSAAEMMKRNTGPALVGSVLNIGTTLFGLSIGWDLYGIAAGFAAGCIVEAALKLRSVHSWLGSTVETPLTPELKARLFSYSGQALVLMILSIVVWDRSDILILAWMNPDTRQQAFFAITFGLTDKLLMLPNVFATALSNTMMAQFGREQQRVHEITVTGARYAYLMAIPLLGGMACVARPFVLAAYQSRQWDYTPMIAVVVIAALMAIPRALVSAPTALLQTVDRQSFLIWTGCVCGALDIGLDFLLTPAHGAAGAAIANGIAQTAAAIATWWRVSRDFKLDLRLGDFGRITLSGIAMGAVVLPVQFLLPVSGYLRVSLSVVAGALIWLVALRLTGAIDRSDVQRLQLIAKRLPEISRPALEACLNWLAPGVTPAE